jgi:hypothetical protein
VSLVDVELFEQEFVVARGTGEIHWFVRNNDSWQHVAGYPSAKSTRLDAPPGTVYKTRWELALPVGTRLMRVESRPLAAARKSALEHLFAPPRITVQRQTQRSYYVVDRRGVLHERR